jgi:hypothetical protein
VALVPAEDFWSLTGKGVTDRVEGRDRAMPRDPEWTQNGSRRAPRPCGKTVRS